MYDFLRHFWPYFSDGDSLCKGDLSNQDILISLSQDEPLTKNLSYPFYIHDVVQGTCLGSCSSCTSAIE